ncbi:hypothetical protein Ahy_A04g019984 [Arachis hypogaea]|uniref:Transposase MuDR plant domain-containing protein n=1 Tax=Arachis hypogaea TaxID=3818 RepID=A0A445DGW5_ARAHY|nr:hypothetical protein Ahy_A04g019984 [Arachis hypogaea]
MSKWKEKVGKDNIMQADDAIVEDLSDVEVDLGFVGTPGEGIWYEALDHGAESDGANSWHSEEMKTPPNSEDELESDGDSDEFPIFQGGQRFVELRLQVGMKFNTKQKFRDVVREFTIQEGRGIKFVKNDNIRCKAVCQVQECSWVVYASRDHEDCIPCVHACAALARVNKRPENFCHPLVTMDSYRKTYEHHINPLPGQSLWEKSVYNQLQAPNIKHKPGKLTTKRRKDSDEGTSGNKKSKQTVTLKRQLKPFTCNYCGVKGHTKRGCKKKRADELAAAAAAVAAAKSKSTPTGSTPTAEASNTTNVAPQVVEAPPGVAVQNHDQVEVTDNLSPAAVATEIDLSQPNYGGTQDEAPPPPPTTKRPDKLPTKRRNSPPPVTASIDPMQGASAATSSRLANFLKFIPTPGFKPPRKKNTK